MIFKELTDFLDGKLDIENFSKNISNEVDAYKNNLENKKSSIPIIIDNQYENKFYFEQMHLKKIENMINTKLVNIYTISYILEAIIFESFEENITFADSDIFEKLEELSFRIEDMVFGS
ncbi:MAG: hypothetical protein JW985_02600 [Alphaproteobacteria bacterium]|nr:hypothetical protein [Alphaproteobacteria bacterium]